MAYALGSKVIKRLCHEQNSLTWLKAKLSPVLFKPYEQDLYAWVEQHVTLHHALPHVETLHEQFPDTVPLEVPEPSSYYVLQLEQQFYYDRINQANLASQTALKADNGDHEAAVGFLRGALRDITAQKYRMRILDVGKEAQALVIAAYVSQNSVEHVAAFGWPYLDLQSGGVMPGDVISFVGRPAVGKASSLDAQVLTTCGFKKMRDIHVGDALASIDGAPSQVTGVFPQGTRQMHWVTFQDGRRTKVSDDHLWEVWYRTWPEPQVLTTVQLIAKLKVKRYQHRLSIRMFSGEFGHAFEAPFSPYLLGCLLGDGCFRARDYVRFSSVDPEILQKLGSELRMQGLELVPMDGCDYTIRDARQPMQDRMKKWIGSLGLGFRKSEDKFIPERYLRSDRHTRLELLRGLMDTDGCAEKNGAVTFSSSSPQMAQQVVHLARSLGYKARITEKPTTHLLHYRVTIVAQDRGQLFTLPRKRQRVAQAHTTHINHRLVLKSIDPAGEGECQCISVSHPSQLYVTDEFVVTHNTWLTLWTALHNWTVRKLNVLYVSMEMMTLPIAQRIAALYTKQNINQLKVAGYSNPTFKKFYAGLQAMQSESAKFYVVDGNLATNVEDLFALADMLECRVVMIDGAYLLRHRNVRLDRFTRAAENVELIKRSCTDLEMMAFCSWQFNREASKKQKKGKGEQGDLEDIGYSDAIGQISSIAVSLFQEDSVETLKHRKVQVMKGRNGEVGQFSIAWDFINMSFAQIDPPLTPTATPSGQDLLQWV
jgi:replicative DNA helicase